jgi:hypothetical protein
MGQRRQFLNGDGGWFAHNVAAAMSPWLSVGGLDNLVETEVAKLTPT